MENELLVGEIPEGFSDGVYNEVTIRFDWRDRLRILFGKPARVLAYSATEHKIGGTRGTARVWVEPILPGGPNIRIAMGEERAKGYDRNETNANA